MRYHRLMAIRVFNNNLPPPSVRANVERAVLEAMGAPSGDWMVQIHEKPDSPSWHITIWGPNNFHWSREFSGPEEQNDRDDYSFIKKTISQVMSRVQLAVYLSYAYPDNTDGFVNRLRDLLAEELWVQTGEPAEVTSATDRIRPGATWSKEAEKLVLQAAVLVPVVSPSYFKSDECRREFELFLERGQGRGRPLIFPVYFVTAGEVENAPAQLQSAWVQTLVRQKFADFRQHRFDLTSTKARPAIGALARSIRDAYAQYPVERTANQGTGPKQVVEAVEPMYVESLRLENFRCFDKLELCFDRPSSLEGRWTCIAGINGSGKSTVLQALGVALLGNPLALELGGERLNRMRRTGDLPNRKRAKIEVELRAAESHQSHQLNLEIDEGRLVSLGGPASAPPMAAPSWDRIRQLVIAGYGATRNLSARIDSGSEHLSLDVRCQITLFDPLSQLAVAEVLVGRQSATWPFLELFRKVVQQVFDADLQVNIGSSGIRFTVSNKDDVEVIDLPDGFRSAAAWIADLCSIWCEKAPSLAENCNPADIYGVVLIDEIDLHLHPSMQRTLIPRLRKAFPRVQWIVTTHSPLVLANFDVNEIMALDRNHDGNIRELDRQILGFTSDEIYDWLMGTRPMGTEIEEELRKTDEGLGKDQKEVARLMRVTPETNEEAARKQVAEFEEILKSLKR
jgi:predicted ATPase